MNLKVNPLILLAFLVFGASSTVYAGAAPPIDPVISPGCDPEFYTVMEARSNMEGQREFEAAQRLILKPDSVLEYSCFGDRVNEIGSVGPNANAFLTLIVRDPMGQYLGNNFGHTLAGGTGGAAPPGPACNAMAAVWHFLKCSDFDKNHFVALRDMPTTDIRNVPIPCPNAGARTANWNAMIAQAWPPPSTPSVNGSMDLTVHYNNFIVQGPCGAATPIPTGVMVDASTPYQDAVCSIPGCYFDGGGGCN